MDLLHGCHSMSGFCVWSKNMEEKCFYCGETATEKDHIIPVSYYYVGKRKGRNFMGQYNSKNLVDCCKQCNVIAGNKIFDDKEQKKNYIQQILTQKYKKIINMPHWSEKQIKEMGKNLAKEIKICQLAKMWILNRINYPIELYPTVKLNRKIQKFIQKEL